jgi:hypothetical protein
MIVVKTGGWGFTRTRRLTVATFALALIWVAPATGQNAATKASLAQLAWLAGSWASDSGGVRIEEHWMAPAANVMVGMNRTVARGRAAFEFLRIVEDTLGVAYLASPSGRAPATRFDLVEIAPGHVAFANPKHDYPQRIRYWLDAQGMLQALVDGTVRGEVVAERYRWAPARLAPPRALDSK